MNASHNGPGIDRVLPLTAWHGIERLLRPVYIALGFFSGHKDTLGRACWLQGLDGFWRWVLEGLHAGAPDLFPVTGLPGDASGFEEAFSAVRPPAALDATVLALTQKSCK